MKELTIKELSAYLPYGLYLKSDNNHIFKLVGINTLQDIKLLPIDEEIWNGENHIDYGLYYNQKLQFKPILYPLDYFEYDHIIQVKEHLGLGEWCDYYDQYFDAWFDDAESVDKLVLQAPYEVFQFFLEIKIDVFSLIEKGLAVAVTEYFNPYK